MLSWKQAWLELAADFAEGSLDSDGSWLCKSGARGLCYAVDIMRVGDLISPATHHLMRTVIPIRSGRGYQNLYAWDTKSPRARVAFCRKMAATPRPRTRATV